MTLEFATLADHINQTGFVLCINPEGKGWRIETDLFDGPRYFQHLQYAVAPLSLGLAQATIERATGLTVVIEPGPICDDREDPEQSPCILPTGHEDEHESEYGERWADGAAPCETGDTGGDDYLSCTSYRKDPSGEHGFNNCNEDWRHKGPHRLTIDGVVVDEWPRCTLVDGEVKRHG